jgi:hypothetical protein
VYVILSLGAVLGPRAGCRLETGAGSMARAALGLRGIGRDVLTAEKVNRPAAQHAG